MRRARKRASASRTSRPRPAFPQRHLESIEIADWDKLPAPTYTTGFAKSYASAVGLDRVEIGEQLRAEMGGQRSPTAPAEVFEPADPARTMPKWLVFGAIAAVIVLIVADELAQSPLAPVRRCQRDCRGAGSRAGADATPRPAAPTPAPAVSAQGAVVLAATAPAWIQVTDQGKVLFSGELQPGQTFAVPPTATAPLLKAGKPEALQVHVGSGVAPPVGPAGRVASNVSLKPADLMRGGGQPSAAAVPATAPGQ